MKLNEYKALVRSVMLPYQWEALNDRVEGAEPSFVIHNFMAAAGDLPEDRSFHGTMWQDSDLYKWLEALAYAVGSQWDESLYLLGRKSIDLILRCQQSDGYLNTYFTLSAPEHRFDNIEQGHELYCAGHMIESAVAWYQNVGESDYLDAACRLADCIDRHFGPEDGKLHGYPGHPELELALMRLFRETGEKRYMHLCTYMIETRGTEPNFFLLQRIERGMRCDWSEFMPMSYFQAHKPLLLQEHAAGHAVRAVYLYTAMASLAETAKDNALKEACQRLWNDIVQTQMYVTGSIGSSAAGESFVVPYYLPLDRAYAETCAAVGLIFFAAEMMRLDPENSAYGDIIERVLWNAVLPGFSLDGKHFFYVNPQEVYRDVSGCPPGEGDPVLRHSRRQRQPWFGCACCPPNAARLLMSLERYTAFFDTENNLWRIVLLTSGTHRAILPDSWIDYEIKTDYPWQSSVEITILDCNRSGKVGIAIRLPEWCDCPEWYVPDNMSKEELPGYLILRKNWQPGDKISLDFPMSPVPVRANTAVRDQIGRIAVMRGPLVFCAEQLDQEDPIHRIYLSDKQIRSMKFESAETQASLHGECSVLELSGNFLYTENKPVFRQSSVRLIPYCNWANRGDTDMCIWLHEKL